ncbi:MAG: hypothetical protein ACJAVI_003434 [Candidatus Azotimanducaceae bacterium]
MPTQKSEQRCIYWHNFASGKDTRKKQTNARQQESENINIVISIDCTKVSINFLSLKLDPQHPRLRQNGESDHVLPQNGVFCPHKRQHFLWASSSQNSGFCFIRTDKANNKRQLGLISRAQENGVVVASLSLTQLTLDADLLTRTNTLEDKGYL